MSIMFKRLITPILLLINVLSYSQEKVIYDPNVIKRPVGSFQAITVSDGIDSVPVALAGKRCWL